MPGRWSGVAPKPVSGSPAAALFAEDNTDLAPPRTSLARAAAWVAPASLVANVLGYVYNLALSRQLGPSDYGELGALLGLSLIALVPALAVQPVVARAVALSPKHLVAGYVRDALRMGAAVGAGTALFVAASVPLTTRTLHLDAEPVLWLAACLATAPVLTAAQGVLQGCERFRALSVVFVVAAGARLLGAVVGVTLTGGVAGALAGSAAGALAAAALAVRLAGTGRPGAGLRSDVRHDLATASVALLGLMVLGNIDVLLARAKLTAADAGLYAVGAVVAKAGFWGPQFVQVVIFARLAEDGRQRLLYRSVALVAGAGCLLVLACALLGGPLVRLAFGARYGDLGDYVWIFAATGSVLAVSQLFLYARLAAADSRLSAGIGFIVAFEVASVLILDASTPRQVALAALAAASLLAAVAAMLPLRRHASVRRAAAITGEGAV